MGAAADSTDTGSRGETALLGATSTRALQSAAAIPAWVWRVLAGLVIAGFVFASLLANSAVIDGTRYFWLDDDQMISMRYARNPADGLGPVWNAGERVEGYTNFLWMTVMAAVQGKPESSTRTHL